jgi:hypothetical protein
MMQTFTHEGLTIHCNDANEILVVFEWDEKSHPQYNFLNKMTAEQLLKILMKRVETILEEFKND